MPHRQLPLESRLALNQSNNMPNTHLSGTASLNHSAPAISSPREGAGAASAAGNSSPRQLISRVEVPNTSFHHVPLAGSSSSSSFGTQQQGKSTDTPVSHAVPNHPTIPNGASSKGRGGIVFNEEPPPTSGTETARTLNDSQVPNSPLKIVVSNALTDLQEKLKEQYGSFSREDLLQELIDTKISLELLTDQYQTLQTKTDTAVGTFSGGRGSVIGASLRSESSSSHLQRINTEMYGSFEDKVTQGPSTATTTAQVSRDSSSRQLNKNQEIRPELEPINTTSLATYGVLGLPQDVASPVAYSALNFRVTKTTFESRAGPAFRRRPDHLRRRVSIATISSPLTPAATGSVGFPSLPVSPAIINQRQESSAPGVSIASLKIPPPDHANDSMTLEGTSPRLPVVASLTFGHFANFLPSPVVAPSHSQKPSRRQSTVMGAPIPFARMAPNSSGVDIIGGAFLVNHSPVTLPGGHRGSNATTVGFNRQDSTMSATLNADQYPIVSGYTLMEEVGSGQYGKVFLALRDDAFLNGDDEEDDPDNNSFAQRADSTRFETGSAGGGKLPSATVVRSLKAIKVVPKRKVKRQLQYPQRPASKASSIFTNTEGDILATGNNNNSASNLRTASPPRGITYKSKHTAATTEYLNNPNLSMSNDEDGGILVGSLEEARGTGTSSVTFPQEPPKNNNVNHTHNRSASKDGAGSATIGQHRNSISTNGSQSPGTAPSHFPSLQPPQKDDPILYEINIMKKLIHRNIVPLEDVLESNDGESLYLVMPYIEKGALLHLTPEGTCTPLDIDNIRANMRQILSAVAYLHKNDVAHCDIKPENILVGKNGELYLSDFGVSHIFDPLTNHHPQHRDAGNRFSIAHTTPSGSPRGVGTSNNTSKRFVTSNCNSAGSSFTTETSLRPTSAECPLSAFNAAKRTAHESAQVMESEPTSATVNFIQEADKVSIRSNSVNSNASGGRLGIGGVIGSFRMTSTKCTPAYAAPETLSGQAFSGAKADVWSVGVTMYVMMFGHLPYNAPSVYELYRRIECDEVDWEGPPLSELQQDLVRRMLLVATTGDSEGIIMEDEQEEAMPALESLLALQTALLLKKPVSRLQDSTTLRESHINQNPLLAYSATTASPHMSRTEKFFEASTDSATTTSFGTTSQLLSPATGHNKSKVNSYITPTPPPNSERHLTPGLALHFQGSSTDDLSSPLNHTTTTLVPGGELSDSVSPLLETQGTVSSHAMARLNSAAVSLTSGTGMQALGENNSSSSNNALNGNSAHSGDAQSGNNPSRTPTGDFIVPYVATAPTRSDSIATATYVSGPSITRFIRKHELSIGGEGLTESVVGVAPFPPPQFMTAYTVGPQLDMVTLSFLGFTSKHGIVKKYCQALDLLRLMLERNPASRTTAAAAQNHDFFGRSALGRFVQRSTAK